MLPLEPIPPAMPETGKAPWIYPLTSTMSDDFSSLLNGEPENDHGMKSLCDSFVVFPDGNKVGFHRVMVTSSCENFFGALRTLADPENSNDSTIYISTDRDGAGLTADDFRAILSWVYSGSVPAKAYSYTSDMDETVVDATRIRKWATFFKLDSLSTFADNLVAGPEFAAFNESFKTYVPDCLGKCAFETYFQDKKLGNVRIKTLDATTIAASPPRTTPEDIVVKLSGLVRVSVDI